MREVAQTPNVLALYVRIFKLEGSDAQYPSSIFFTGVVLLVVLADFLKSSPPSDVVLLESVFACFGR